MKKLTQLHTIHIWHTDICQYNIHFMRLNKFYGLSAIFAIPHKLAVQTFPVNVLPDRIPDQDFIIHQ